MDRKLLFKMLAIGLMALFLLIPLAMVECQISDRAASHSPAIVDGLLRQAWSYDGLLITDDLNMGAVYRKGIGRVAGEALAAGIDLVLVSYDPRQVYRALAGAAQALAKHRIAPARLAESDRRLADFANQPAPDAPTGLMQVRLRSDAPVSRHQPDFHGQARPEGSPLGGEKAAKIEMCPAPSTRPQFGGMSARL